MNFLLQSYYFKGANAAAIKLGTAVGPIPYAAANTKDPFDYAKDKGIQSQFKSLDDHNSIVELSKNADYIRGDLNKIKPHNDQITRSAIEQAFNTNNAVGEELGLGDPGFTQPHGSEKAAFANPLAGGSSPMPGMSSIKIPGVKPISSLVPKIQAPKAPGANLKSSITDMSHSFLDSQSNFSRAARGNGSPF